MSQIQTILFDLDGTILLASDGEKITVLKPSSAKQ